MSLKIADRLREITSTAGIGPITLQGAVTQYVPFSSALSNGDQTDYCVLSGDSINWEVGRGTYNANVLTRTTVWASTNGGNRISLVGTSTVFGTASAKELGLNVEMSRDQHRLHWGADYPFTGYVAAGNSYLFGSSASHGEDVSFGMRVQNNIRFEAGSIGDTTDGVINNAYHIKEVRGAYPNESFSDRMVIWHDDSPRYPWTDIMPATGTAPFAAEQGISGFRIWNFQGSDSVIILGNATYGYPGRTGEGLTLAWESNNQIARITSATWNAFYRSLIFEAGNVRFVTGAVFQFPRMFVTDQGAVNIDFPIQHAVRAVVSNAGQAASALMSGYVPNVDILTQVAGSGRQPKWRVTTTRVSKMNGTGIIASGTGGTQSVGTTLTVAAVQGAPSIVVANAGGFAAGDVIDIKEDASVGGGYLEVTILSISGNTLNISPSFDGNASVGNNVYKRQTVTTTTGVGTPNTFSIRVGTTGTGIAEVLFVANDGSFTTNPTVIHNEPVTGSGITAGRLTFEMGARDVIVFDLGAMWDLALTPVHTTSNALGVGAFLEVFYENSKGSVNAVQLFVNGRRQKGATRSAVSPHIVFDGDSLTTGLGALYSWVDYLNVPPFLNESFVFDNVAAVAGATALSIKTNAPTLVYPLRLGVSMKSILFIWVGINDLRLAVTPAATYTRIQDYVREAQSYGYLVGISTLISSIGQDTNVATLNGLILAGGSENFRANITTEPLLSAAGAYANTTYFQSDGVNLTDAGHVLYAQTVEPYIGTFISGLSTSVALSKSRLLTLETVTFAQLPPTPPDGLIAKISNSNTNTRGAVAAGGGANRVLVQSDLGSWLVI